ncbi:hypothetical protein V7793_06115 [Streptomyces sp. KLMMK]|uniref:hypothetical protein n=1 Tax=Streptomyces sp. KLMMK TaxID=3109353 RepID=UPI00300085E9
MTSRLSRPPNEGDQAALATLRAHGYHVPDIQSLAHDQRAFAVRAPARRRTLAPGIRLQTASVDLGGDCFTNVFTLRADLDLARAEVVSAADGFHLRDHVGADAALAAVSGSFSFISDDPSYQPAEPCLDFCCRAGEIVSLPTAAKPAFLVHRGQPLIDTLNATGTLSLQGQPHRWIGSKTPRPGDRHRPGAFTVFGAANCRVRYRDHPRTGFIRHVQPTSNITPLDPSVIDGVVSWRPGAGHRVTSVHPGGGADLFAGNFVLRAECTWAGHLEPGARVEINEIDGLDVRHMECGVSLGPSVADAARGLTTSYDECLGASPFRDARYARTLIALHGPDLVHLVLDGAPLSYPFRGVTPREAAAICTAEGLDPHSTYHLDGGGSSKIAFLEEGTTRVLGSMHYLKWPSSPDEPFRWQGLDGRVLRSGFTVKPSRPEGET